MKLSECKVGDVIVVDNSIGYITDKEVSPFDVDVKLFNILFEDGKAITLPTSSEYSREVINLGPGECEVIIGCNSYNNSYYNSCTKNVFNEPYLIAAE